MGKNHRQRVIFFFEMWVLFGVLYKAYFVEFGGGILARKEHEPRFIYPAFKSGLFWLVECQKVGYI